MNNVNINIHILADSKNINDYIDFNSNNDGRFLSTDKKINVNKSNDGYSIIYHSDVINGIDKSILLSNLIKLIQTNLPNTIMNFQLYYHHQLNNGSDLLNDTTAIYVIDLHQLLLNIYKSHRMTDIQYTMTDNIDQLLNETLSDDDDEDTEDDEYWDDVETIDDFESDDDDEDTEDDDFDQENPFDTLNRLMSSNIDDHHHKKSKKNDDKHYNASRAFRNAKNPRRSIRRHGVIIADKSDINKDAKVIKGFLKDFIPGGADWKKDFRRDILSRWMQMYAISKKQLKRYEKDYRKACHKKAKKNTTMNVLKAAHRLFNTPIDSWNDPRK